MSPPSTGNFRPSTATALRALAVAAGVILAGWLAWEIGPAALAAELRRLSWRLPLLLLPQAATNVLHAAGWGYAFPRVRPGLALLLPVRLAGEAINDTTPTGTLGGDAVKAVLVARAGAGVPVEEGLVSVVVAKTALVASLGVFVTAGLALAWTVVDAPPALLWVLVVLAGFTVASSVGFVWAQVRGLFRIGGRALGWLGLGERATAAAAWLDRDLRWFYRTQRGRLVAAATLNLLGWAAGALETWLALAFLGSPVSLPAAMVIEAGATGVRAAAFLVPGSLGVQEGGLVGILALLGLGPGTGLAVSVIRRLREAILILAGYACLALARRRRGPAAEPGA